MPGGGAWNSSSPDAPSNDLAVAHGQLISTHSALVEQAQQREAAENQLRQSQKMEAIGQLSGGIAHDFNNMLGVISGSLDLMHRRIQKRRLRHRPLQLEAAQTATKRSAALTQRLLAFAQQQPLAPEPLDANRMIGTMSDLTPLDPLASIS